jgi:hypothetical protein
MALIWLVTVFQFGKTEFITHTQVDKNITKLIYTRQKGKRGRTQKQMKIAMP